MRVFIKDQRGFERVIPLDGADGPSVPMRIVASDGTEIEMRLSREEAREIAKYLELASDFGPVAAT